MIVFYYTDIDNLERILASTSRGNQRLVLKAKHRCYLNDDAQRTFGRYLLPSCISSIEAELGVDSTKAVAPLIMNPDYLSFVLESINTYNDHKQGIESFVLSFSEDQDNVELWRRNANNGRGIAIGFDTGCLQPDYEHFINVYGEKCCYWSENIKSSNFRLSPDSKLYASILETYKLMSNPRVVDSFNVFYGQNGPDFASQCIKDTLVANLITTYDVFHKQDIWRNEKEYRISLSSMPVDVEFVKDENGDYFPYANVTFPVSALRMIVAGPKVGKNAYGMIKSLLMRKGVSQDVVVLYSAVKEL